MNAPPTLFKYEPFSLQAIQNLKRQSIYFGSPSGFNDPFDCALTPRFKEPSDVQAAAFLAHMVNQPDVDEGMKRSFEQLSTPEIKILLVNSGRQIFENEREDFNTNKGISCFSEVNNNMLMWSHYGGQHRGFCLEFHTDHEPLTKNQPVRYESDMPEIDIARVFLDKNYKDFLRLFCTKSTDWSYEREWRVIHGKAGTVFTYEADALAAVYFGAKMTKQDIDLLCLVLHGQNPTVKLYKGDRNSSEFKIEFEQFTYSPLASANGDAGSVP